MFVSCNWVIGAVKSQSSEEAYVTLLYGDEFLLGVRVLGKSIRDSGSIKDMVVLVSDGVSQYANDLLRADGWIVEKISLLSNPNQVRPTRFWGVYTKLKVFNMTKYKKVVYLDADTIVVKSIEDLFKCGFFFFCKIYNYGFLNSYYVGFANARVYEPNQPLDVLNSRKVPEMERLSTLYNTDVGLYMLANKWMVDEKELRNVRVRLQESLPGTGGGKNPRDELVVKFLFLLPLLLIVFCYYQSCLQTRSLFDHIRQLYYKIRAGGVLSYSSVPSSTVLSDQQPKVPAFLGGISICVCFAAALVSLGLSLVIIPHQVMPWTGLLLMYEWMFTLFFLQFGSYLHLIYQYGKAVANQAGQFWADPASLDHESGKGHQRQQSCCDIAACYYGLGMAFLAILTPALPSIFGITALFLRLGLMVVGGLVLVSFMTNAAEHLPIRSFMRGFEEKDTQRNRSICFLC
ncbi:hypothetical protein K7X08_030245 [Anisodus acutangulus]|uniref:Hexosyltransferase n=1 Tax=Anisodus acutangulus TaxID=402998 RepID=A0A9Q1R564_9SOLA|nr:hypothetical protein K7X08_030245 [Anisodus acutangulus]